MILDGNNLTAEQVNGIAQDPEIQIEITSDTESHVTASRKLLERFVAEKRVIYGVNTACGGFVHWLVPIEKASEMQQNLLGATASNVGDYLADNYVRAIIATRINSLARGASAISLENFKKYIAIFNAGILPCIPEKGSLGASGDLGPLAYIGLVATGHWKAKLGGKIVSGKEALQQSGIEPMTLSYKEGLAMINGTSAMTGMAACLTSQIKDLIKSYLIVSSMSVEALKGKIMPFHEAAHENKPHPGQIKVAKCIFSTLQDSKMVVHDEEIEEMLRKLQTDEPMGMDEQIEDAYSIRATPQILGPVVDTTLFVESTIQIELNSTSDNPLVLPSRGDVFHNANFHGQYISNAMDQISIALTTMCNLSDRRTDRFLDPANSNGLKPFLCDKNPGLSYGLMGGQYLATSLVAEIRSLCTPVSIQTLTSTGDFQDHVSFGLVAARRTRDILKNAYYVLGFELICACQAADLRGAEKLGTITSKAFNIVREKIPFRDNDDPLTPYIEMAAQLLETGRLLEALPQTDNDYTW
ncbi:MAG: aromatic amino acid lyase [Deltaproteobacteria bacterium]|nr:aromatic amino acid lyase [Deltaproteobacteria bacterium]